LNICGDTNIFCKKNYLFISFTS